MKKKILIPCFGANLSNYENALQKLGADYEITDKFIPITDFDGLLLPGGADIDPIYYHQEINGSYTKGMDRRLDKLQLSFLDQFVRAKKPVFGICRGHQLINVYFKGTLIQHLSNAAEHSKPGFSEDLINEVYPVDDNIFRQIYGERFFVNSSHHQAVDRIGEGLKVCLRCSNGTIEAMAHESLPILSVQFHPERMCYDFKRDDTIDGSKIIAYYLNEMIRD